MQENNFKIQLRAIEPEDIDLLFNWENDRSIWNVSNTLAPFSRYILTKYIESSNFDIYQTRQVRLMIDLKTHDQIYQTIGAVDIFDFEPFHLRAGVGILIHRDYRGRGFAGEALKALLDYVFNTLQLHQLYCNIEPDNEASLKLFLKYGFKIIGTKKDWNKTKDGFKDEISLQLICE